LYEKEAYKIIEKYNTNGAFRELLVIKRCEAKDKSSEEI
jgi:hypothetical protein